MTRTISNLIVIALGALAVAAALTAVRYVGTARADTSTSAVDPSMGLAVPPAAGSATPALPAPVVAPVPPAVEPTVDDVRQLWRRGEYLGAGVLVLFGLLVVALKVDPRRALYYTAGIAALGGCVDLIANGQTPSSGMLVGAVAVFAALVTRSPLPAPASPRQPERGSVRPHLLAGLALCAAVLLALTSSCAATKRTAGAVKDAVVDCTGEVLSNNAQPYADRVEAKIIENTDASGNVKWGPVRSEIGSILADAGLEVAGCAGALAVARILYPTADRPRGIVPTPEPSPARVRDGWAEARESMLGGRRFLVQVGAL